MPRFFVTGQAKKHGGQFDNWANCQLSGNMCRALGQHIEM